MRGISFLILLILSTPFSFAEIIPANLPTLSASLEELQKDLLLIEREANFPEGTLKVGTIRESSEFRSQVKCQGNSFTFNIAATKGEQTSTLYKALKEMGFYFPHPHVQVSPGLDKLKKHCGKSYLWRPALRYRGFHLHNLHPNEWVLGFFMNRPEIAEAYVRWLARNGQNVLDMSVVRTVPFESLKDQLTTQFTLARKFEIQTGIVIGLAFTQQKSYKLLSILQSIFGWGAEESIEEGLAKLYNNIPLSFILLEAGTSEFTPTNYEKTLDWLNLAAKVSEDHGAQIFTRAHISVNQADKQFGNYNFLSQHANANVGVWPHTVMFYSLEDKSAPMYENENFVGMKNFMLSQKGKRPNWFYPETSWWLGMDIDVPIFLTDYLYSRAEDFKLCYLSEIEGHVNFSTGHALGYWLFDWNLALINDLDYDFSPTIGLKLLGEPLPFWEKMIRYQHEWIKQKGIISMISAPNLQDELSDEHRIHKRFLMKELRKNPIETKRQFDLLEEALVQWPDHSGVKNDELREVLEITRLRIEHALYLRKALLNMPERKHWVDTARVYRRKADELIAKISKYKTNYPELPLFDEFKNPTSYQFGYAYPAGTSYWWKREEKQVVRDSYIPWRGNIFDVWNILL